MNSTPPLSCSPAGGDAAPPRAPCTFGDAERLLLSEARARYEFEQRSSGNLHTKSALFLTFTGVFAALAASSISRLLDQPSLSTITSTALAAFVLCLGLFVLATILLVRSALLQTYQVIASPKLWAQHLAKIKLDSANPAEPEDSLIQLESDLLAAWSEAAEACAATNDVKSATLDRVARLISFAVPIGFMGILLLVLNSALR